MKIILHDRNTNYEYGIRVCERDLDKFVEMLRDYNDLLYDRFGAVGVEIIAIERFFKPAEYREI